MIHDKQWHLDEAERLTDMLATLTSELDLTQPAQRAQLESVEHQAELHLKIAAAMPKPKKPRAPNMNDFGGYGNW